MCEKEFNTVKDLQYLQCEYVQRLYVMHETWSAAEGAVGSTHWHQERDFSLINKLKVAG